MRGREGLQVGSHLSQHARGTDFLKAGEGLQQLPLFFVPQLADFGHNILVERDQLFLQKLQVLKDRPDEPPVMITHAVIFQSRHEFGDFAFGATAGEAGNFFWRGLTFQQRIEHTLP